MDYYANSRRSDFGRFQMYRNASVTPPSAISSPMTVGMQSCVEADMEAAAQCCGSPCSCSQSSHSRSSASHSCTPSQAVPSSDSVQTAPANTAAMPAQPTPPAPRMVTMPSELPPMMVSPSEPPQMMVSPAEPPQMMVSPATETSQMMRSPMAEQPQIMRNPVAEQAQMMRNSMAEQPQMMRNSMAEQSQVNRPIASGPMQNTSYFPTGQRNCPGTVTGPVESYPVAMGYVPMQQWRQTYSIDDGFMRGTIFPELDLPFVMGRCY